MGEPVSRGILDTSVLIATDVAPIPGELAISVASLAELHTPTTRPYTRAMPRI
jgi:hypothetical protein